MILNQQQRLKMGRFARFSALSVLCLLNAHHGQVSAQQQRMTSRGSNTEDSDLSAGKLRSLGEEASMERRFDDAIDFINRAILIEPENALNHYRLFLVHKRMKRLEDALADLTTALEIDKSNSSYRKERAKLLVSLAQCNLAVEDYRILSENNTNVNQKDETDAKICAQEIENASHAFQINDHEQVIFSINSVLQYTDHASDLLFMRAKSSFELGDFYTTVSDTAKILKQHNTHLDAYQLRGDAYFHLGEFDAAVNHYRLGLKYDPEHKGCKKGHKTLKSITKKAKKGDDALAQGNHEEAIKYWSQAVHEAEDISAFTHPTQKKMVNSFGAMGKHDLAIRLAQNLLAEEETIEHYFVLGDAQLAADKFDESIKTYRVVFDKANDQEQKQKAQERVAKAETALKQSKTKNYYKILGISRTATQKEIKKAYRELALEWHPDKNANNKEEAERMFMDINEANEVLSNDELRGKYDRGEDVFQNQGGQGQQNPFMHHQQFFHGGGGQHMHFRFN